METGVPDKETPRRLALLALAGSAAALLVALLVYSFDLAHLDAEVVANRVRASGALGPLSLMALLMAQAVIAPLPSPPILMAAGFVYGPWLGFGIGWFGLLLGASACFGLARVLGRPFAERFVRPQRLAAVDEYVRTRTGATLLTLVSLRVFMPPAFDAVSYGCGLVRVPFSWFALATALGEIPKVGSFTYIGAAAGGAPSWLTAWVLLAPMLGVIGFRLMRRRRVRADAQPETGEETTVNQTRIAENLAAVEAHFHAEAENEVAAALKLYTDDIVWEAPALNGLNRSYSGKEAVTKNYRDLWASMRDVRFTFLQRFATEDRVVDDSLVTFEVIRDGYWHFPVGSKIEMRLVHIFEMRDGKIARELVFDMGRPRT